MDLFEMNLNDYGAPGFKIQDRLDISGHSSGKVLPHINSDLINPSGTILGRINNGADFRDLSHNQLPGFNGMQHY